MTIPLVIWLAACLLHPFSKRHCHFLHAGHRFRSLGVSGVLCDLYPGSLFPCFLETSPVGPRSFSGGPRLNQPPAQTTAPGPSLVLTYRDTGTCHGTLQPPGRAPSGVSVPTPLCPAPRSWGNPAPALRSPAEERWVSPGAGCTFSIPVSQTAPLKSTDTMGHRALESWD